MMAELKPCPFCGSEDVVAKLCHVEYPTRSSWYVCCKNCDKGDLISYLNEKRAIEAWNTRYERTCTKVPGKMVYGERRPKCSECGQSMGDKRWNYCPNCGAKVVKEEE